MYKVDRHRTILEHLRRHTSLGVEEAMRLLGASSATIRRDFSRLIGDGLALRGPNEVRRLEDPAGVDRPVAEREMTMRREKDAIARRAARLLGEGDVAFIDGGTTTYSMVRHLAAPNLRIVTTCIRIANALNEKRGDNSGIEVSMPGGTLLARSCVLYGPQTCSYIESLSANWSFIGVDGTDGAHLYSVNEFVSSTQRTMIGGCRRTVLLADHSKFGRPSMVKTAELDGSFTVITDAHESSKKMVAAMRERGVEVICLPM